MQLQALGGRVSAEQKYDLLTAMGSYGLSQGKSEQRRVLRLITLITARYNWRRNLLCVGQREIAKLWGVDTRTVKRELAKLRSIDWIVVMRQGARGRVSEYRLNSEAILRDTKATWSAVGPDFETRMSQTNEVKSDVIPLRKPVSCPPPDPSDTSVWGHARVILYAEDPGGFGSWLNALTVTHCNDSELVLKAPSKFHSAYVQTHFSNRILSACRHVAPDFETVICTC